MAPDTIRMKKIYIATSWKNSSHALGMALELREKGHEVDCFCDDSAGRFIFNINEIDDYKKLTNLEFLHQEKAIKAFEENKKWIEWCDTVIMLLPCGKSSHLEAGYAKGIGKEVIIIGSFPKGDFDVMYGFADFLLPLSAIRHWGDISSFLDNPT